MGHTISKIELGGMAAVFAIGGESCDSTAGNATRDCHDGNARFFEHLADPYFRLHCIELEMQA